MAGVVPGDLKRLFAALRAARPGALPRPGSLWRTWSRLGKMCMPAGTIGSPRSGSCRCKIEGGRYTRSCEVTHPSARRQGGCNGVRRANPFAGLPGDLRATFQRAPLHALLVPRSCIAHEEAMSLFPHWMAAVAQAFSQWIGSWVARDITAFREWSRVVSAQSWALLRGTMVRSPDGQSDPWLQVYANHPAVGNVMGWPREVLPVPEQPLCSLPIVAVAVVLDVGTLWLYHRQLRRAIPAVTERRSMAVLVGSKQLARIQGDDAQGHVTEAMFSLPEGDDHVAADVRHTLDTLGLAAVIEARAGGQRLVLASARGPGQDGVDVIGEVLRDYGWELLRMAHTAPKLRGGPG